MATIRVIFRSVSREAAEGTLFFRVIHKRRMRQLSTGCRVMRQEWDNASGRIVAGSDNPRADYLKNVDREIVDGLARISQIVASLDKGGREYSASDVVERYQSQETVVGFLSFARKHIRDLRQAGKVRNAEHHATALNSFIRFNGSVEIPFGDFTATLMQRYESHLRCRGLCPNTTSYYMRNLRAIYHQAMEQELTEQNHPFRHVYTGVARTVKRAVTLPMIKTLRGLDLREDPLAELARNLFLFSFYTRGMAIIDVAYLRKDNLRNGILTYRRRKTGQLLSIRWEPQMEQIVSGYADKDSDFLFPLINSGKGDFRKQFLNSYSKLIRRLKKIGNQLGLSEPLTFHRSRHAWASIARENNVPLSVICEGMGHDSEKTTRIYLASLHSSAVDKANSDIMGLLDM